MVLNARLQDTRQRVKKYDEYTGVLGDGTSGNPKAGKSRYWVRFPQGVDETGQVIYTPARAIRYAGEASLPARSGVEVLVRVDPYDEKETITRMVPDWPERVGFDAAVLNSGDPISRWFDVRNFIRLVSRPVGQNTTNVTVRENPFHVDDFMDISTFKATVGDEQLTLGDLFPASGSKRLACIFFDFLTNEPFVTASTAQDVDVDFDLTDYEECFAQIPHNEVISLASCQLIGSKSTLVWSDLIEDLRTWLPTPRVYGWPNPIPDGKSIIVRSTHQMTVFEMTVEGELTVEGEVVAL